MKGVEMEVLAGWMHPHIIHRNYTILTTNQNIACSPLSIFIPIRNKLFYMFQCSPHFVRSVDLSYTSFLLLLYTVLYMLYKESYVPIVFSQTISDLLSSSHRIFRSLYNLQCNSYRYDYCIPLSYIYTYSMKSLLYIDAKSQTLYSKLP